MSVVVEWRDEDEVGERRPGVSQVPHTRHFRGVSARSRESSPVERAVQAGLALSSGGR